MHPCEHLPPLEGTVSECGGCVLQGSGCKAMLLRVFTAQKYEGWLRAHAWPHQAYPWRDSTTYAMLGVIGWEDSGIPSNSHSYGSMTHHQHVGEVNFLRIKWTKPSVWMTGKNYKKNIIVTFYIFWRMSKNMLQILFLSLIFISWRLLTLQYCSGFCHTLTWI